MKKTTLLKTMLLLCALIVGSGSAWAATKEGDWDLTSASGDWTSSNCETYFSQPYGMKKANAYIMNKAIDDFSTDNITQIKIGVKCLQNGGTTSRLTVYLVNSSGTVVGDGQVITPTNETAASKTAYKYVTFTTGFTGVTGFKVQCTTFGKNILINGASYQVTFTAPSHTATFSINGVTSTEDFAEGSAVVFPSDPSNLGGKAFVGWKKGSGIDGTTDVAPSLVTKATEKMGNTDVTYYAVFATSASATITKTDNLTYTLIGVSGTTYTAWDSKTDESDAVYKGKSAGGNTAIQIKSADSDTGIVTTTSGGKVKKVVVTWNSSTADNRTLDVYGKNSAYSAATDLYDNGKKGTKIGSIVYGTSTELTISTDYTYIGLRSNSGAMYIDNIAIDWSTTGTVYSAYCTTIPSSVSGTISASGWNTFSSSFSLDLSTISGGTAYYASAVDGTEHKVTLTSTDAIVNSGEGLMIKGTAGDTFTIYVTSDAATFAEDNLLVGLPSGGTVAASNNNYVFGWSDPASPGFYYVNSTEPTLGAGKAYLHTTTALANQLNIDFDESGDITGIKSVTKPQTTTNGEVYNLAGQRVNANHKGIVIVNGKKFFNK